MATAAAAATKLGSLFFHAFANSNLPSLPLPLHIKPGIHHDSKITLSIRHHHFFLRSQPRRLLSFAAQCEPTDTPTMTEEGGNGYGMDIEQTEDGEGEAEEYTIEIKKPPGANWRPGDAGRLFVGGIPYSMTSQELAEIFSQAGNVQSAEVIYDRITDRSRGFAFVHMASVDDASKAIEMLDGSQLGGRTMKVNFPEVPRGGERELARKAAETMSRRFIDTPYKIYAGNLGWGLNSDSLREAFADLPGLLGAKVIFDLETGRSRGFGFVTFASEEEMKAAMEAMNGQVVEGRPLRLSPASRMTPAASSPQAERNTSPTASVAETEESSSMQTSSSI